MRIDIFTIFPGMFDGPFSESIIKRAVDTNKVDINIHNIREYSTDRHKTVDDYSYGGGPGMVMKPEPIFRAVESVAHEYVPPSPDILDEEPGETVALETDANARPHIILLTPQGCIFHQRRAEELSDCPWLMLICGHYEGVDERVREHLINEEISIGDYVLTGGELPAMVLVDAVVRLIPGVVEAGSIIEESHTLGLLEYPQYTRPADFRGYKVPDILLSGNHGEVDRWRRRQALLRTAHRRPDLLARANLSEADRKFLQEEAGDPGRG